MSTTVPPEIPGYEFAATNISSLQVGGDYFDFVDTVDGRTGIVIADVSGKGIPAALLMANLQAALQGQAIHPGSVAAVVKRINSLLVRASEVHMFATFFYGVLDRRTGQFTYCNAGHNPPVLQRVDGSRELLTEGGTVIGVVEDVEFLEASVALDPGDVIVMYTDGVSEAEGPAERLRTEEDNLDEVGSPRVLNLKDAEPESTDTAEIEEEEEEEEEMFEENMFGEDRLFDLLTRLLGHNALQIRDTILQEVMEFSAGVPQSDDITLVVVRRLPHPS